MADSVLLPKACVPSTYALTLRPNFKDFTFTGRAIIDVSVQWNTRSIVFHSAELSYQRVSVTNAGCTIDFGAAPGVEDSSFPPVILDEESQTATLSFGDILLLAGPATLDIEFSGTLNDKMVGFYRSVYKGKGGAEKVMATTQFEAIDARRAFPCWDEPAWKATFDITLEVPADLIALSNMPSVSREPLPGNLTRVKYGTSPIMSTYLVAFVVGELERVTKKTPEGIEVNVWTTPGKKDQGRFALAAACRVLSFFTNYFNIAYPLPKADLVAIPDFASGAMENWGLITFRETALLVEEGKTSAAIRQRVAYVVAHELAHQWFGNLVTMEWWNDLWLNEGFATWVGTLGVAHLFPEWDMWTQFTADDVSMAMSRDALMSSHPIEVPIKDPKMIGQVFDALSYQKGACVIRMLEAAVGPDSFKRGLHLYLKKHKYGNAKTTDLWSAIGRAASMDVATMMNTWTTKMGFPLITIEQDGSSWAIEQHRFVASGPPEPRDDQHLWWLPVSGLCGNEKGPVGRAGTVGTLKKTRKLILGEGDLRVPDKGWLKLNAGQAALCRVNYPEEQWARLAKAVGKEGGLPAVDRLGLASDAWALARSGQLKTSTALDLSMGYMDETELSVWKVVSGGMDELDQLLSGGHPSYDKFCRAGRRLYQSAGARVGWDAVEGESHLTALLRTLVLGALSRYGCLGTIEECRRRFAKMVAGEQVHPDLVTLVMVGAVRNGGASEYDAVLSMYRRHESAEQKLKCLQAMGATRDPALVERYLEWAMNSGDVRMGDVLYAFATLAGNPAGRQISWDWVVRNWAAVYGKFKDSHNLLSYICTLPLRGFSSHAMADEATKFFEDHQVPEARMAVDQSIEAMRAKASWLERDAGPIAAWLDANQ